jgi:hypothetical protein
MDHDATDPNREPRPARSWAHVLSWPMLLALAWLLYELTAQPALAVAAVCVKFGWEDFCTAFWLWWKDPNRGRANACFWLYFAAGLWLAAIAATAMLFGFAFLTGVRQQAGPAPGVVPVGNGPPPHVIAALLTALIGFGFSTLLTCLALVLAWCFRVKLWLDGAVHRARRAGRWPPTNAPPGRANKFGCLLGTALVLTALPAIFLAVGVILALNPPQPGAAGGGMPGWMPVLILALLIGIPALALGLRDFLSRRVMAKSAAECWGPDAVAPADGWAEAESQKTPLWQQ